MPQETKKKIVMFLSFYSPVKIIVTKHFFALEKRCKKKISIEVIEVDLGWKKKTYQKSAFPEFFAIFFKFFPSP